MRALSVVVVLSFQAGSSADVTVEAEAGPYVQLASVARRQVDAVATAEVEGRTYVVHYPSSLGEPTASRFLEGLRAARRERDRQRELLHRVVRDQLGTTVYDRVVDGPVLAVPDLASTWYLLVFDRSPYVGVLGGGAEAAYHLLQPGQDGYSDDDLRPSDTLAFSVQYRTGELLDGLLRRPVPAWLHTGLGMWTQSQFRRYDGGGVDGGRETLHRLLWRHPDIRSRTLRWRTHRRTERFEDWEYELLTGSAHGMVVSFEAEVGATGVLAFLREQLQGGGERSDRAYYTAVERRAGRPLDALGEIPADVRTTLFESLLARVETACSGGPEDTDALPLRALGLFHEMDRAVPALVELTRCPALAAVSEGLDGLRYGGHRAELRAALDGLREHRTSHELGGIAVSWTYALGYATSKRARRWYR